MGQLMVIAVSVDDGTIQPTVAGSDGSITLDSKAPARVIGCLNSDNFDQWVKAELDAERMKLPAVHMDYQAQHTGDKAPAHVGEILFTHNSPGRVCVTFNGVPVCFP